MAARPADAAPNPAANAAARGMPRLQQGVLEKARTRLFGRGYPQVPEAVELEGQVDSNAPNSRSLPGLPVATMSGLLTSALLGLMQASYP